MRTATPNLNKALSQLQGELPKVTKAQEGKVEGESKASGKAFSYTYKYADLADVTAAVGPLLAKHGLSFFAAPTIDPASRGHMILAWSLLHESGEERCGEWPLGPVNQKPQTLGSMVTYARRYCLGAATGIVAEEDDDGQRAQRDHGSRQSAGDIFEQSTPAPPRQNGNQQRGQVSRQEQPDPAAGADPGEVTSNASARVARHDSALRISHRPVARAACRRCSGIGVPTFSSGTMEIRERWCGRRESNPHEPCGPTDFRTVYGFRRPGAALEALAPGLRSGLSLHHLPEVPGLRCCPSSLYTFPGGVFRRGLARDCHFRVPRI